MRVLISLMLLGAWSAAPQQKPAGEAELRTRQLWNTKFQEKRPVAKKPAAPATKAATPAPKTTPATTPQQELGDGFVGITIWRLRQSRPGDDKQIRISAGDQEWTPERIQADTPLAEGQKVRVGIETARQGYLYVIDLEQYADGSFGRPTLIFPTLRTHGGNNQVRAGRLIEIPGWQDNPPYFTLRLNRADQSAELLTLLVTPEPISDVRIGDQPQALSPQQVETWQEKWGASVHRIEARDQVGKPYTRAEKEAGSIRTRLLTHEEPLPQTLYYCDAKPGDPLLVNVPLRIGK